MRPRRKRRSPEPTEIEAEVPMPFEHALLSLDDGRRLRAAGNRPAAVAQLEKAHRLFSDLGADPTCRPAPRNWPPCRSPPRPSSPAALLGLSRAELAVARLVATGLTNREVASQLYVSVKTVEYHLRNSYIKLDITSRRALAALLLRQIGEEAYKDPGLRSLLLDPPAVMGVQSLDVDHFQVRLVARTLPGKQFDVGRLLRIRIAAGLRREGINLPVAVETGEPGATD
jgi:DNA-binding CsgD family transcriptional regulator